MNLCLLSLCIWTLKMSTNYLELFFYENNTKWQNQTLTLTSSSTCSFCTCAYNFFRFASISFLRLKRCIFAARSFAIRFISSCDGGPLRKESKTLSCQSLFLGLEYEFCLFKHTLLSPNKQNSWTVHFWISYIWNTLFTTLDYRLDTRRL